MTDGAAFSRDWLNGCTRAEMAALHGYTNLNAVSKVRLRLGLPTHREVLRLLAERELSLAGGRWAPVRGVQRWVPDGEREAG